MGGPAGTASGRKSGGWPPGIRPVNRDRTRPGRPWEACLVDISWMTAGMHLPARTRGPLGLLQNARYVASRKRKGRSGTTASRWLQKYHRPRRWCHRFPRRNAQAWLRLGGWGAPCYHDACPSRRPCHHRHHLNPPPAEWVYSEGERVLNSSELVELPVEIAGLPVQRDHKRTMRVQLSLKRVHRPPEWTQQPGHCGHLPRKCVQPLGDAGVGAGPSGLGACPAGGWSR